MRVLHLIQNLNYGGMEKLLTDLSRGLANDRVQTHVLVLQYRGRFARDLAPFAGVHEAGAMSRLSMVWPRRLALDIEAIRPDIVHTHSGVWHKGSLAARVAGVPKVVHTDHGRTPPDPWMNRVLDRLGSSRTDVVVAVSDALAEQLRISGVVSRSTDVRVIRNGVDTSRFKPGTAVPTLRTELGFEAEAPIIGTVGRLEPVKAYDVLIRAIAQTGEARPELLIVGDGSERRSLEVLADRFGVSRRVHFLGWRDDIQELLGIFTVFAMSSRSEGTSISLLEAMSSGVCPVVTDVGGNRAVLGEGLEHRLVPPDDSAALARALGAACRDTEARQRDAGRARTRVERHFSLDRMVADYLDLYLDLHQT